MWACPSLSIKFTAIPLMTESFVQVPRQNGRGLKSYSANGVDTGRRAVKAARVINLPHPLDSVSLFKTEVKFTQ